MYLRLLFLCSVFLLCVTSHAKISLPDVLSDNMVLQQNSYIKIWGTAKPRSWVTVTVSWNAKEYKYYTKKDGSFRVSIKTPQASFTAQTITIAEEHILRISNVLIGEVWFCSGQSNMEMPFKGFTNQPIANAEKIIAEASPENGIRMLTVKRNPQDKPVKTAEGKWKLATQQTVPYFSATAYFFALSLREKLNVPVGIINSSWGGSGVEGWMNRDLVDNYKDLDLKAEYSANENYKRPWVMYNGMVKPFTDYTIKGFLWYQGEGNVGRYATYTDKLRDLAALWRYEWKLGNIPFYIVEITPYEYDEPIDGAKLREAQYKAAELIPNSGIVCTNDLVKPEEAKIAHPANKEAIGNRLCNLALLKTYGIDTVKALSATYSKMDIKNNVVTLKFNNCYDGLILNKEILGFEIAGEDKVFYPANASKGQGNCEIQVRSDQVSKPVAVRYCFRSHALGNVSNSAGLPLIPFRTDNWGN